MRAIILGASRFGTAIAENLINAKHEVVIIDKDRERLEKLSERLDCGMIEGDGTLPTTLREAFSDSDDVFIAVTNASDDNILASIVARSVGYGRVIPQITSRELMDICKELELKDVINPHAAVAESICAGLEDKAAVDNAAMLNNELALKRVQVPKDHPGGSLADMDLPESARPIAGIRNEKEFFLDPETELQTNDYLVFAIKRDEAETLDRAFAS